MSSTLDQRDLRPDARVQSVDGRVQGLQSQAKIIARQYDPSQIGFRAKQADSDTREVAKSTVTSGFGVYGSGGMDSVNHGYGDPNQPANRSQSSIVSQRTGTMIPIKSSKTRSTQQDNRYF